VNYPIPIFVGFDPREAVNYHTFCQSVIEHSSRPVSFIPLANNLLNVDGRQDGSNDFIYSRFLVPHLMGYQGWAIYADGDMVCLADIAELWDYRFSQNGKGLYVVKHDYETKAQTKYLNNKNENYPRKNWSSVILWNCGFWPNRSLTPEVVAKRGGAYLHRFEWLSDQHIGDLPQEWNHLVTEYDHAPAKLVHYTLGSPCFEDYADCDYSDEWKAAHWNSQKPIITHAD
jgi:lipopolysaccharide biosynthesis glycosyltransferase